MSACVVIVDDSRHCEIYTLKGEIEKTVQASREVAGKDVFGSEESIWPSGLAPAT